MRPPLPPAARTDGALLPRWPLGRCCALALALTLTVGALTGCQSPPPAPSAVGPVLAPPAALRLQGVPPVPAGLPQRLARYTDSAGHGLVDWVPGAREMLVRHLPEGGTVAQLWRVSGPGVAPVRLTDSATPIGRAFCEPVDCRHVVYEQGSGGNEAYQLIRQALPGGAAVTLTPADQRHSVNLWLHQTPELLYTSLPLDRTAALGRRTEISTTLWRMNPAAPEQRRQLAELPGGGWQAAALSRDDRRLALLRYLSAESSQVWLMDSAGGTRRQVLPAAGAPAASFTPVAFSGDGASLYVLSDAAGEFRELLQVTLADGAVRRLSADVPWDVVEAELSDDDRLLALRINIEGRHQLRVLDARSGAALALPALPPGSVRQMQFRPRHRELAFSVDNAQGPNQLFSLDIDSGRVEPWTRARLHPALDTTRLTEQQIVRWTSFDGRQISGLLNRPPARFTGRRPVFVSIHGGPESQAQVGFAGRGNHLLQELGIAILQPNVRGSTGFGKTFLSLDNGRLREDAVKDIGALLDWIATQPDLDPQRVVVSGGSYGGYMSLAVAATYPLRIAGAIDSVGISHFVTFLENTESYRRDLRRVEYGDERDPEMRAFLDRISPLSNAHRITRPLMVVQGRNDPRVPLGEAEQIVAKVRANGGTVWYLLADNEGHGFARKENADYQFYATVLFLQQVMGLPAQPASP